MKLTHYFTSLATRYPNQTLRLKWGFWFLVANIVLSWIFGIKFLTFMFPIDIPSPTAIGNIFLVVFIILTYFSYLALLTTLFFCITIFPLTLFIPHRSLLKLLTGLCATIYIMLVLTDSIIFRMFRFHLNYTYLRMIFTREVFAIFNPSTLELIVITAILLAIALLEFFTIKLSWYWVVLKNEGTLRKKIFYGILAAMAISILMYYIGISYRIYALTEQIKVMPYYTQIIAALSTDPNSLSQIEQYRYDKFMQLKQVNDTLHYPLHPLHCKAPTKPYNIVIIGIDTWRLDALNPRFTPNIYHYLPQGLYYSHHYSGGNSTQPGIFSLFYSIPNTYWTATINQHVGPVFIDELLKQHYQLGIFASAELTLPAFNKNVFIKVPHLKLEADGDFPADKDRSVTVEFKQFLQTRSAQQPFFSFLFYDAAHAYCTKQNFPKPFQPAIKQCLRMTERTPGDREKFFNRYANALHFVDSQVGSVLRLLQQKKLLDHTIVIITGDHGQEFDDNHRGYWEHASNYTPFQIQTPLLILWPKQPAKVITQLTTHYDIVPTLLQHVLNCNNASEDYSIGQDLFNSKPTPFTIEGSYINFGIVTDKRIIAIYPSGNIDIQDLTAKPLMEKPNSDLIFKALYVTRKYYEQTQNPKK